LKRAVALSGRRFAYLLIVVSRRRWGRSTAVAVVAMCASSSALADTSKRPLVEAFTVQPAECLEREQLVPAVAQWLGHDEIDRRISITVRREGDAVVYGLLRDSTLVGERTVTSLPAGCAELTTALALSIAVAIEATFFGREEQAPPQAAPLPTPPPVYGPPARAAPPRKAVRVGPQATLAGEAGLLWNTLPGIRPLISAGVDVAWSSHFETRTAIFAATAATSPLGSGEVETRLFAGRADACATRPASRLELRACLGVAWGFVAARGVGFVEQRSPSQPWLGLPLRVEGRLALGSSEAKAGWGLLAATELVFTMRRAQMGVAGEKPIDARRNEAADVLTLPVVGGAATVGLYFDL
jgi:hypothetical protein